MKRCCETCRFFEKGILAGSGWCRHPERLEATSDLVLVRASQLTCRKGWDKDFWEPNARSSRTVDRIPRGAQLGPVPPASPEDIDAIINAGKVSDGERAVATASVVEDRVVGATPSPLTHVPKSLITKHLPPAPELAQPESVAQEGPNSREKILIAKEEVARMRINNRIRPSVEPLPSHATAAAPPSSGGEHAESLDAITNEPEPALENTDEAVADNNISEVVPPVVQVERAPMPLDALPRTDVWDSEPLVPSIPPTFDHWNYPADRHPPFLWLIQGGNSTRPTDTAEVGSDDGFVSSGNASDVVAQSNDHVVEEPFELPPPVDAGFRPPSQPGRTKVRARKQRQAFTFRTRWTDARERPRRQEPAPLAWSDVPERANEPIWTDDLEGTDEPLLADVVLPELDQPVADLPLRHVEDAHPTLEADEYLFGAFGADGPSPSADLLGPETFTEFDAADGGAFQAPATAWTEQAGASYGDRTDVVVGGYEVGSVLYDPEIDDYLLAPEVPRMCRTCAAFRPADDGERGWCSNGWAFDNRLLVSAWDVPCETSFGNWWIPNDDHWSDGILERLNAPAPLFDLLMAQRTPPRREKPSAKKRWS